MITMEYGCADSDCAGSTQCGETDCFGIDNDGDGNTDCTDSECYADSACQIYSFDGTYAMDVTLSTGNASVDDCIGTLNVTLTTDGYNHADLVGTGMCTSTALGTIALSVDGFAFQFRNDLDVGWSSDTCKRLEWLLQQYCERKLGL